MQFNVTVTEENNTKTFTVDVGTRRKTRDFKVFGCDEVCEALKTHHELEGYELVQGTAGITRRKGRNLGTYVFVKEGTAVATGATEEPTTATTTETSTSTFIKNNTNNLNSKGSFKKTSNKKTRNTRKKTNTKTVAVEE